MRTTSLITALLLGAGLLAAPALAKTSLTAGEKICKEAVKTAEPGAKSVRADGDDTLVNESTLTYVLKVKKADDSSARFTCKVDRATDAPTLSAAK